MPAAGPREKTWVDDGHVEPTMRSNDSARRGWSGAAALAVALLLAACGSSVRTPEGSPAGTAGIPQSPTPGVTLIPTPDGSATRTVEAGPIVLVIPAAWSERSAGSQSERELRARVPRPGGSAERVHDDRAGRGDVRSLAKAGPAGERAGRRDPRLVQPGVAAALGGRASGDRRPPCPPGHRSGRRWMRRDRRGQSISFVFDRTAGQSGWTSLDACLAGPDVATAEAAFYAILPGPRRHPRARRTRARRPSSRRPARQRRVPRPRRAPRQPRASSASGASASRPRASRIRGRAPSSHRWRPTRAIPGGLPSCTSASPVAGCAAWTRRSGSRMTEAPRGGPQRGGRTPAPGGDRTSTPSSPGGRARALARRACTGPT